VRAERGQDGEAVDRTPAFAPAGTRSVMTTPHDPNDRPRDPADGTPTWGEPGAGQPAGGQQRWNEPAPTQPGWGPPPAGQPGWGEQAGGHGGWGQPKRNGLGTAALIVGILALVTSITVIGGVLFGIAAIVLGVLGRGRVKRGEADNGGMATAGIVLGVLGLLAAIALVAAGAAVLFNTEGGREFIDCVNEAPDQAAVEQCEREFQETAQP
jgi:hypothetical protein